MPIVVEHLSHAYSNAGVLSMPALQDVSLTIEEGEFLCIIGHTGSGKTTFVQHLNGLLLPTSGTVTVDGLSMEDKSCAKKSAPWWAWSSSTRSISFLRKPCGRT